jgi:hypothetical protein
MDVPLEVRVEIKLILVLWSDSIKGFRGVDNFDNEGLR